MITDFSQLIAALVDGRVRFVVIGGVALIARGGSRVTRDLDICYARDTENLESLAAALAPLKPTLRGAPPDLPFLWDALTLKSGLNFSLSTVVGAIDIMGEVPGLGGYPEAMQVASVLRAFDRDVAMLDLAGLERTKRAAGRAKDLIDLEEIATLKRR
jgi:hypothetical protein